jgi:hypothetical protein
MSTARNLLRTAPRGFFVVGDPLADQSDIAIRAAVKDCLAHCYRGGTLLGAMAEFLGKLRDQGWSEPDVRKVETAVRRLLAGIVTGETHSPAESEN